MALTPDMTIFRHRSYAHYWVMTALASGSRQMQVVVIGAQVYLLALETRSVEQAAFVLGLVGPRTVFAGVFLVACRRAGSRPVQPARDINRVPGHSRGRLTGSGRECVHADGECFADDIYRRLHSWLRRRIWACSLKRTLPPVGAAS